MSEIQPSIIDQLSNIHNKLDSIITYEMDVCGNDHTDLNFYKDIAEKVYQKIQELKK